MTRFELLYSCIRCMDYALPQWAHRTLAQIANDTTRMLDVGGRRSNYTIGIPGEVWISDIPREQEIQKQLDLGATDAMQEAVLRRRSNVVKYLYDDMSRTKLPLATFDIVSAMEVLEHVDEDDAFLANVARVLKPGGHFVMSTPNGDFKPVPYPDHRRHYKASELRDLLARHFAEVQVSYGINTGLLFDLADRASPALGMLPNALNALLERMGFGGKGPRGKQHLLAVCRTR